MAGIPDGSPEDVGDERRKRSTLGLDRRSAAEALRVLQPEIAASDRNPRRRDVALDQLGHPRTSATKRPDSLETTRTHRGSRARWRSFTSPQAITTSKASPVQRYHTGTVWALPSLR